MKKALFTVLAIAGLLSIASCSGDKKKPSNGKRSAKSGRTQSEKIVSEDGIIKRADGSIIKIGGYKASSSKPTAKAYSPKYAAADLPPSVDLRKYMTKVESQGQIGSCTANAAA